MLESNESILSLPEDRQLHYATAGNPQATCVILFFAGILSIGSASEASLPSCFSTNEIHYVAPTIPGNGESSSTPRDIPYHRYLCEVTTTLLEYLHPSDGSQRNAIRDLYVAGGSYGTVMCQMLYGAPFAKFPFGRKVRGMLLLAPFSPFREHKDYARHMTWSNWLSVGPPSQVLPFRAIPRLLSTIFASRCHTLDGARGLLDLALFSNMDAQEREMFEQYAQTKRQMSGDELKTRMAAATLECSKNWDGYIEVSDVLHSDWGFCPPTLDREHSNEKRPVLVVHSDADPIGKDMALWLTQQYGHAQMKTVKGGHLASLYYLDDIWAHLLELRSNAAVYANDEKAYPS